MQRYLAISWHPQERLQCDAASSVIGLVREKLPDFTMAASYPGLAIFHAADPADASFAAIMLPGNTGVILGKIFTRVCNGGPPPSAPVFNLPESHNILASCGRRLVNEYWGQYTAILHDAGRQETYVLSSPTNTTSCHVMEHFGIQLIFSSVGDCIRLGARFSTNWEYVRAYLVQSFLQPVQTGLTEVAAIRPGECMRFCNGRVAGRDFYWDLSRIAVESPIEHLGPAVAEAQHTIRTCVGTLASNYPRLTLMFSGGVDSSVVLAALMRAPINAQITCLHYFDTDKVCDERTYARMVVAECRRATGAQCEYIEVENTVEVPRVESVLDILPSPVPIPWFFPYLSRHTTADVAHDRDAVVFTGHGGDNIFYRDMTYSPSIDYVLTHGLGHELLRVAYEDARNGGRATLISTLWQAVSQGKWRRHQSYTPRTTDNECVRPEVIAMFRNTAPDYLRPAWMSDNVGLPPGKMRHIESMYAVTPMRDGIEGADELRWQSPLVAQPILELFARIQTHVLAAEGSNRVVARKAFVGDLGTRWYSRRSKAYGDPFVMKAIRRHRRFFTELLLDGILVQEGLLDKKKVETILRNIDGRRTLGSAALVCSQVDLEIWLRRCRAFTTQVQQAAA